MTALLNNGHVSVWVPITPDDIRRIEKNFPGFWIGVYYGGDWGFGSGRTYLGRHRHPGKQFMGGEFLLLHVFNDNQPIGPCPMKAEMIITEISIESEWRSIEALFRESE